ncbi:hypothetical protein GCM10010478_31260 [Streptomyces erythrogriseus]|uniref:Secreted protein n=1 Tax=Streptomyces erythrogriseus TaxID=284027 RepID=A0ABN3WWL1_9ACTN
MRLLPPALPVLVFTQLGSPAGLLMSVPGGDADADGIRLAGVGGARGGEGRWRRGRSRRAGVASVRRGRREGGALGRALAGTAEGSGATTPDPSVPRRTRRQPWYLM